MRTIKPLLFFILVLLVFSGCKDEEKAQFEAEKRAIEMQRAEKEALASIEEANQMIPLLLAQGKFDEAGRYFAEDVVQMISGQPAIMGRDAWVQAQKDAAELGDWKLELEILDFQFFGENAVERGRGVQTFTANASSPIPSMQQVGHYLVFWKKYPKGWKIQYDYVVIDSPGPGAANSEMP